MTIQALCDILLGEVWDWKLLGLNLGISNSDLKDIEHDYRLLKEQKLEMLRMWLQIDECPSWSTLVEALVYIHQRYLARIIAEKCGKIVHTGSIVNMLSTSHVVYRYTYSRI